MTLHQKTEDDFADHISRYLSYGWKLLPVWGVRGGVCSCDKGQHCSSPGKHPIGAAAPNGVHSATGNLETINQWRTAHAEMNLAVATGTPSRIIAIDLDLKEQDGEPIDGEFEFDAWLAAKGIERPRTLVSDTGSGGKHIILSLPDQTTSKNIPSVSAFLPAVDIRGDGGYIVIPPSKHVSGGSYSWSKDVSIAPVPDELVRELSRVAGKKYYGRSSISSQISSGTIKEAMESGFQAGSRDDSFVRLAGALRKRGDSKEDALEIVKIVWGKTEQPGSDFYPLNNALEKVERGFERWPAPEPQSDLERAWAQRLGGRRNSSGLSPSCEGLVQPPLLPIEDLSALMRRVDEMPPRKFLIKGIMAEGDYGVLSAEFKVGKTWALTDLAISVASGTSWLGTFEVESSGKVLMFAGEGGERKITRRARAISDGRGLQAESLPLRICLTVPQLTDPAYLEEVHRELEIHKPILVIIDPLYLAASGANSSDLFAMGSVFSKIQTICQEHESGLLIAHHWNKTGNGKGAQRNSGAGTEAWARILISLSKYGAENLDPITKATSSLIELQFQGDEISSHQSIFQRTVWSDDPNDVDSPLRYEVGPPSLEMLSSIAYQSEMPPAARQILTILQSRKTQMTVSDLLNHMHDNAEKVLGRRTVQGALLKLTNLGEVEKIQPLEGRAVLWQAIAAGSPEIPLDHES